MAILLCKEVHMKFHLNHTPAKAGFEIEHEQKLMLSGSCFSEEIGRMLREHRFQVLSNPDGILFNPLSIFTSLDSALHLRSFPESMVVQRDELFFSYLHHSDIHGTNKKELLHGIRSKAEKTQEFLWSANFLIITFGSAWVYE